MEIKDFLFELGIFLIVSRISDIKHVSWLKCVGIASSSFSFAAAPIAFSVFDINVGIC